MNVYKKNIIRVIYIIILIFMFATIFYLSSQNGERSSKLSEGFISNTILKIFGDSLTLESKVQIINSLNFIIRKLAHVFLYFIIGSISILLLRTYDIKNNYRVIFALSIGIIYSEIDEIHQTFVSGRSGSFSDVIIDTIGIVIGIVFVMFLLKIYNYLKKVK